MNTTENQETINQAFNALRSAGIPLQQQHFPLHYHNEAVLHTCPSIQPRLVAKAAERSHEKGSFEELQAVLAGALIHLMFYHPAEMLKALHSPAVREVVELASGFDWEKYIGNLQKTSKQILEEAA